MVASKVKRYSELIQIDDYMKRFDYLKLGGKIGTETFGFERYLNQKFYQSSEWKRVRDAIIIRDNGCDLAYPGREICSKIIIHHINPILPKDIIEKEDWILNPEFLVCVSKQTHDAIHYGDRSLLILDPLVRTKNDTCPWRKD